MKNKVVESQTARRARDRWRHVRWSLAERWQHMSRQIASTHERRWKRAISKAEIVSFDVFDTALFRCVISPSDVFEIVGHRLRSKGLIEADPADWKAARIQAETQSRRLAQQRGESEVTLLEIHHQLRTADPLLGVEEAYAEELAVEAAVLVANPDVKSAYDALVSSGKQIIFISDTYFPETFVAQCLAAAGFEATHKLFASSSFGATKDHGSLFDVVLQAERCSGRRVVHLGDNKHADVDMALRRRIDALWYRPGDRRKTLFYDDQSLVERVISRMEALAQTPRFSTPEQRMLAALGAGTMGPIFLGFTQWLARELTLDATQLLLFCARDGYLIQRFFELFEITRGFTTSRYFEVSRRALNVPSIETMDERALNILCGNNAALPLSQFFSRIGLNPNDFREDIKTCGLELEGVIDTFEERSRLRELFLLISDAVIAPLKSEVPLVLDYCRNAGCMTATDIVIVDIGWGASLQSSLATLINHDTTPPRLRGFYLSTDHRASALSQEAGATKSWFCNAGKPAWMQAIVSAGYWILEITFAAPSGSVLGYQSVNGSVVPVLQDYDVDAPSAVASRALQFQAYAFGQRWNNIFDGLGPPISSDKAFRRFERLVNHPSRTQARFFGDILHHGGLGNSQESHFAAKPPSLRTLMRSPLAVRKEYHRSHWKRGYLSRALGSHQLVPAFNALTQGVRTLRDRLNERLP